MNDHRYDPGSLANSDSPPDPVSLADVGARSPSDPPTEPIALDDAGAVPAANSPTRPGAPSDSGAARQLVHLPHLGLLRFAGPDAIAFLQGQVSNDARPLAQSKSVLASYSTPQGRVLAILHLLPHSSGIIAILPSDIVLPTLERLRKYVLRSKVQIQDVSDHFAVLGLHGSAALAAHRLPVPQSHHDYVEHEGIGVAHVGTDPIRVWAIGTREALAQRTTAVQPSGSTAAQRHDGVTVSPPDARLPQPPGAPAHPREPDFARLSTQLEHEWRLADIRAGLPQVYAATREMFVAQMLNLDLIDGISFTKGCFTGQEIVARTQHLGRIKRRLFRLRLPAGTWAIGQAVHLTDGRSGRLTELGPTDEGVEALAVLNVAAPAAPTGETPPQEPMDADMPAESRVAATELPLPYPLG